MLLRQLFRKVISTSQLFSIPQSTQVSHLYTLNYKPALPLPHPPPPYLGISEYVSIRLRMLCSGTSSHPHGEQREQVQMPHPYDSVKNISRYWKEILCCFYIVLQAKQMIGVYQRNVNNLLSRVLFRLLEPSQPTSYI